MSSDAKNNVEDSQSTDNLVSRDPADAVFESFGFKQNENRQTAHGHSEDTILLDAGSTLQGTFMNSDLVSEIRTATVPVSMSTNAGQKTMTQEGEVRGIGAAWFDPNQIANVAGFSHLRDKCRITCDSQVEDAFAVHLPDYTVKFK